MWGDNLLEQAQCWQLLGSVTYVMEFLDRRLLTILAAIMSLLILWGAPQTKNIIWQLPGLKFLKQEKLLVCLSYTFIALTVALYVLMALALFRPEWLTNANYKDSLVRTTRERIPSDWRNWIGLALLIIGVGWQLGVTLSKRGWIRWFRRKLWACYVMILVGAVLWAGYGGIPYGSRTGAALLIIGIDWQLAVIISKPEWIGWFRRNPRASHLQILMGVWLLAAGYGDAPYGSLIDLSGRALSLLLLDCCLGSLIWRLPKWSWSREWVSYRTYTIWAVFHLVFMIVSAAWVLDAWYDGKYGEVRVGAAAILLLVLALMSSHPVGQTWDRAPNLKTFVPRTIDVKPLVPEVWFDALECRLNSLPDESPAVFIAASGGGSRAALFTAMVLEGLRTVRGTPAEVLVPERPAPPKLEPMERDTALATEPLFTIVLPTVRRTNGGVEIKYDPPGPAPEDPNSPPANHIAVVRGLRESREFKDSIPDESHAKISFRPADLTDHVVLISSVSGGSLATAYHLHRNYLHFSAVQRTPFTDSWDYEFIQADATERKEWESTYRGELFERMNCLATDMYRESCSWPVPDETIKDVFTECGRLANHNWGTLEIAPWLPTSPYIDDMSIDYMAPLLRGVLDPNVERGESVTKFWDDKFKWRNVNCYTLHWRPVRPTHGLPSDSSDGFDLRLMSPVHDVSGLPTRDRSLIIVADVRNVLHFRVFEDDGNMVVDTHEDRLPGERRQVAELKSRLSRLWGTQISQSDKNSIIAAVTAIVFKYFPLVPNCAPLALFNACDVDQGSRLIVGFPPLPPGLIRDAEPGARRTTRGPAALTDYDDLAFIIKLAEAVRLSANFPWGFEVAHLPLSFDKRRLWVLDGGIVDNSGIDSIVHLLRGLRNQEQAFLDIQPQDRGKEATNIQKRAANVMSELRRRGVLLLQIDSGTKRIGSNHSEPLSWLAARVPLLRPIQALDNASYTNADLSTLDYDVVLARLLEPRAVEQPQAAPGGPPIIRRVQLTCNNSEDVMTAWSLGPDDKAKVLVQFLREWKLQKPIIEDALNKVRETVLAYRGEGLSPEEQATKLAQLAKDYSQSRKTQARQSVIRKEFYGRRFGALSKGSDQPPGGA